MKFTNISLVLLSSVLAFTVSANDSLQKQRATYQKITQLLNLSQNELTHATAKSMLDGIPDYPLYPYVEYRLLEANKTNLNLSEIEDYQQRYPTLPFAHRLKQQWLEQLQIKKDWQTILTHSDKLSDNNISRCILLQAKIETTDTPQSDTLLQSEFTNLWLTGNSLPKQCDPVLMQWKKLGNLSSDLIQQRAVLALEKNNSGLLSALVKLSENTEVQHWLNELNKLSKTPHHILDPKNIFFVNKLSPDNSVDKRILLAVYPAYLKKIKDTQIKNPNTLFEAGDQHSNIAQNFKLTEQQIQQWKNILVRQIFDTNIMALQQWRDKQLVILNDDSLLERRIRMAIREKADISVWLEHLSPTAKSNDEWRYWQAKVLQQQGKNIQAEEILLALSKRPRGYYPMLAAAELKLGYMPEMHSLTTIKPKVQTTSRQTTDNLPAQSTIEQQYYKELQRITELRYFDDNRNANLEWQNLLNTVSFEQKLHLAAYAETQQWYDLSVEATIQAKAWSYIKLRLPNAYLDWFDLHLQGKKIDRTFAMAIARQESAWKPYVTSSANARGLMQLLPSTAKATAKNANLPYNNESQLFDPFNNIMLGTAHLQELYERFGNNRILIASAYNAGPHRVDQWLKRSNGKLNMAEFIASIPFYETRGYVQNVLAYDTYYQILQDKPQLLFTKEEYNRLY